MFIFPVKLPIIDHRCSLQFAQNRPVLHRSCTAVSMRRSTALWVWRSMGKAFSLDDRSERDWNELARACEIKRTSTRRGCRRRSDPVSWPGPRPTPGPAPPRSVPAGRGPAHAPVWPAPPVSVVQNGTPSIPTRSRRTASRTTSARSSRMLQVIPSTSSVGPAAPVAANVTSPPICRPSSRLRSCTSRRSRPATAPPVTPSCRRSSPTDPVCSSRAARSRSSSGSATVAAPRSDPRLRHRPS